MDLERSPLTVSDEARNLLIAAIQAGTPPTIACQTVGVTMKTYNAWRRLGEIEMARVHDEGGPVEAHMAPYVEFVQELDHARAQGVVELLKRVHEAGSVIHTPQAVRANIWMLQRMAPAHFADNAWLAQDEDLGDPGISDGAVIDGMALLAERLDQIARRRQAVIDVVATETTVAAGDS